MADLIMILLPIVVSSICLPFLFRKAGFDRKFIILSCLPLVLSGSAFLAVVFGKRIVFGGPSGFWALTGAIIGLAVIPWPERD